MTDRSAIEWTQATWNPVTGCDRISPGCQHCYALTLARRLKAMGQAKYQADGRPPTSGPGFGVALHPHTLGEPLRWRRPRRIFVCSMADLLHAPVPDAFIAQVFATMAATLQHTYQVLTQAARPHGPPVGLRRLLPGGVRPHCRSRWWAQRSLGPSWSPLLSWSAVPPRTL
jgi:protein gp37